ncbi:MAG: ferredoxin [Hyphomicrobiales bacterium]|nr:ferredoxin [Hyphomicrobiales bacterium]MCP4997389.1 ferredoxin [Hyphomicrobiales bacterium]
MSGENAAHDPDAVYGRVNQLLEQRGLMARGGLYLDSDADLAAREHGFKTIVLAGHVGSSFWQDFEYFNRDYRGSDPLDAWSKSVGQQIELEFGCKALYPFEKPWWPFQSWINRTEGLKPSPLAILMHPQYGLWHGYRAAFAFRDAIAIPAPQALDHACDKCAYKPCIAACPASAVSEQMFQLSSCRKYLSKEAGCTGCMVGGCLSRNACPVGSNYRYNDAQLYFHMNALDLTQA